MRRTVAGAGVVRSVGAMRRTLAVGGAVARRKVVVLGGVVRSVGAIRRMVAVECVVMRRTAVDVGGLVVRRTVGWSVACMLRAGG